MEKRSVLQKVVLISVAAMAVAFAILTFVYHRLEGVKFEEGFLRVSAQADDPAADKARELGLGHERPGALTAQGRGFQDEGRQRRAEGHGYPVGMRGADRAHKKRCACNSLKI